MKYIKILFKAILAGICIGIGGAIYLTLENKIIGSIMFGIGLFTIVTNNYNLYTGKIGYVINNNFKYIINLLIILIGNFLGTLFISFILRFTRIYTIIHNTSVNIVETKLNDSVLSIFILSFLCGILMFIAVNGYKTIKDSLGKNLIVFICVSVFILCGFEHCIANMFYFNVANIIWSWKCLLYLIVMVLGNSCGSIFIALMNKYTE